LIDSEFGKRAPGLLEDIEVPEYFKEDLFSVLDKKKRPPYRWLVIAPRRSGLEFHLDQNRTSTWSALVSGRKRWILFPPNAVPPGVDYEYDSEGEDDCYSPDPLRWFTDNYPRLQEKAQCVECIQGPGEIIFIPSGWWHMQLNLEDTVAVTHSFCNTQNFSSVYHHLRGDDLKIRLILKKKLMSTRPDLFEKYQSEKKRLSWESSSSSSSSSSDD